MNAAGRRERLAPTLIETTPRQDDIGADKVDQSAHAQSEKRSRW